MRLPDYPDAEPKRFSLPLAAASGAAIGFYPGRDFSLVLCLGAVGIAAFGAALGAFASRGARLRRMRALALSLGLAFGATIAGVEAARLPPRDLAAGAAPQVVPAPPELSPAWVEGRLASDSVPARNGFRSYSMSLERLGLAGAGVSAEVEYPSGGGSVRVLAKAGAAADSGALVRARGSPAGAGPGGAEKRAPAAFPGDPGSAFFARNGGILVLDRGSALVRVRSSVRDGCRSALARIGTRSAGLYQALILGVRDSLGSDESEAFKSAGCSHILALSGEHLSVFAILAVAALRGLVGPTGARLGGAAAAGLFMWVAGPGPSLVRAVLMAWIGAAALAVDRPQRQLDILALAFLVMLPLDPEGARSLSFTLSYLAVWGLAVLGPRFSFLMGRSLPPPILESAAASCAAQAAVSPLLAFSFGYLQLAGIPASMAAGPLVAAMMWWGMGSSLLCSLLPFAAPVLRPVSDLLYDVLMEIMRFAAACPPILLPSFALSLAGSAAVAALAGLVYARPYAEYRAAGRRSSLLARLRFAPGPAVPAPGGGPRHVQALRPELPGEPLG